MVQYFMPSPVMPSQIGVPFMSVPMPFTSVPASAPMSHWWVSSPIVGATRPMFAPGPFHGTWPTFAPGHFHTFPATVSTTSSTSGSARPTPTKTGSGRGCEGVAAGQPVMYGAFPWPDPYYGMARAVPNMMPQVYTGRSTPGGGSAKPVEAGGAGRPVATPSSYTAPAPPQSIAKQAPTASPPRNDSVSLYSTIPKAQPSDSTPHQSPYPPYNSRPSSSSQVETSSPAPTITFPPPAPAPMSTNSPPAPEEEVPIQIHNVETKPARQVMSSTETAPDPEPAEPREAGVGLMFVIAAPPKKGWVVKTVIKQSPADVSGKIQEGHVLTDVNGKSVTDIKSLNALSKMLMGLEGTSISLTFKIGSGKKAKNQHVTLVRSNAFLGEDGNNKERQWKATRTDWIDPNSEGVEM